MKTPTLTEIKKSVIANGGSYKKCNYYLNGNECWEVNGKVFTKSALVESFVLDQI